MLHSIQGSTLSLCKSSFKTTFYRRRCRCKFEPLVVALSSNRPSRLSCRQQRADPSNLPYHPLLHKQSQDNIKPNLLPPQDTQFNLPPNHHIPLPFETTPSLHQSDYPIPKPSRSPRNGLAIRFSTSPITNLQVANLILALEATKLQETERTAREVVFHSDCEDPDIPGALLQKWLDHPEMAPDPGFEGYALVVGCREGSCGFCDGGGRVG